MSQLKGSNLEYTKQYNLRIVHEVIRLFGPLTRAEVARHTELTPQTVSNLVRELIEFGLVTEEQGRPEGRGAPPKTLAVNPEAAFAIGLDLDRDHLTGVLVDLSGRVRQRVHYDLQDPRPEQSLDLLVDTCESLMARQSLPRERVWGVGVGIPGPMYQSADGSGYVVNPRSFPGWHKVPLAQWLRERLKLPIFLENNGTAAAIGERWYGAGQQIPNFYYVYFGSALGGGLILNGQPHAGLTGNAGEIGYLPLVLSDDPLGAEESPHVGLNFRIDKLFETLRAAGADARGLDDLARLLRERNPRLLEWLELAADQLAGIVLTIEYVIDPDAVFFGGRLPTAVLADLVERVQRRLPVRRVAEKSMAPLDLVATAGSDAAALGVATLPIYDRFSPATEVLLKQRRKRVPAGLHAPWTAGVA
jgi:predicted NBD/HSP70 family sugar kinase